MRLFWFTFRAICCEHLITLAIAIAPKDYEPTFIGACVTAHDEAVEAAARIAELRSDLTLPDIPGEWQQGYCSGMEGAQQHIAKRIRTLGSAAEFQERKAV